MIKVNPQTNFVYSTDGFWIPPLNLKQYEIFQSYSRYLLVHGPRYSGKCVSGDTLIRTASGLCRMKNLVPFGKGGESMRCSARVISADLDGKSFVESSVSESWKEPSKSAKLVTCYRGYSVKGSPWHPLWVQTKSGQRWMTTSEIEASISHGNEIWMPISFGHKSWSKTRLVSCSFMPHGPRPAKEREHFYRISEAAARLPRKADGSHNWRALARETSLDWVRIRQWATGKVKDPTRTIEIDESVAYFVGLMIGDGCCSPKAMACHFVGFADGDGASSKWISEFLKSRFPKSRIAHREGCDYAISGRDLLGLISSLGMCCYAHEKTIPDVIVESPKSVVRAFLSGLFDTDGTADKYGRVSFCSSSPNLARDVQRLLCEFGIESRARFKKNDFQGAWIIDLVDHHAFYNDIGFRLERKQERRGRLSEPSRSRYHKPEEPRDTFDGSVKWQKIQTVTDCAADLFDVSVPQFSNFIGNGTINHNTFGIIHRVLRHAFDVDGAMVAVVCKTLKNAKSSGVWLLLCRFITHWAKHCKGFTVLEGPKLAGDTKLSFVRIRNRHGTVSEIQCHSLEHAQEVEEKFKSSCYSMFWLSEVDQFCTEHAFGILCDALRMTPFIPFEQHQIIADCNPPDTGTNNWIWKRWFKYKDSEPEPGDTEKTAVAKAHLHRILVMIADNPQLAPEQRDDLIERYRHRPSFYNRFVLGIWEMAITDGHFSEVWDESKHVLGKMDCPKDEQEVMIPTAGCRTLLTGWDMGEKNHSFHIIEKIANEDPVTRRQVVSFSAIDEIVIVGVFTLIADFVEACLERISYWEKWQMEQYKIALTWRHWSDTSAFEVSAKSNTSDAAIAYEASGGLINLIGAPKHRGSNRDKVNLLSELLGQGRLHISAQLLATRAMFANLRKGSDAAGKFVADDDHKHPFDSLAYPIIAEAPADMLRGTALRTAKKTEGGGLIMARM